MQLHRCAPDSGCCLNEGEVCAPIDGKTVVFPFFVSYLLIIISIYKLISRIKLYPSSIEYNITLDIHNISSSTRQTVKWTSWGCSSSTTRSAHVCPGILTRWPSRRAPVRPATATVRTARRRTGPRGGPWATPRVTGGRPPRNPCWTRIMCPLHLLSYEGKTSIIAIYSHVAFMIFWHFFFRIMINFTLSLYRTYFLLYLHLPVVDW